MGDELSVTLCFPDQEKTCFACCPPIRPSDYEHIQYKNIIKRFLRENNDDFKRDKGGIVPITGFSCWALGYIDKTERLVGCLLHPAQNADVDLRYRIDYGEKCQRETCPEAEVFSRLDEKEKMFWLHLAEGLDSFSYSSRKFNPLLNLMGWGENLLSLISRREGDKVFTRVSFFQSYPFFLTPISPRANAYLINQLITQKNVHLLARESFRSKFEILSRCLSARLRRHLPEVSDAPYVHLHDLDRHYLDFLRLSVGISKIDQERAEAAKKLLDQIIKEKNAGASKIPLAGNSKFQVPNYKWFDKLTTLSQVEG